MTAVALVGDLMDRSRIGAAIPDVQFVAGPRECADADVVVVDLGTHATRVAEIRQAAPQARIVAFGRHDNPGALEQARSDGADVSVARSRFFRDPAALVTR
jgi:hypothetical protein